MINITAPCYEWGDTKWTGTADLRSIKCFQMLESNYDIQCLLKKHGVLNKRTKTDSEYSQFWAYFSTKKAAENFKERLIKYVMERHEYIFNEPLTTNNNGQ
jgi:hypothetical protein